MRKVETITNETEKRLKKLLKLFAQMSGENILQIFILFKVLIKKKNCNDITEEDLVALFFESLKMDEKYKKLFKEQDFKDLSMDEIGAIVKYVHKIQIQKTIRSQKKTDLLRLHKQLVLDNSSLSFTELTKLINKVTRQNISRSTVVNFINKIKKEN